MAKCIQGKNSPFQKFYCADCFIIYGCSWNIGMFSLLWLGVPWCVYACACFVCVCVCVLDWDWHTGYWESLTANQLYYSSRQLLYITWTISTKAKCRRGKLTSITSEDHTTVYHIHCCLSLSLGNHQTGDPVYSGPHIVPPICFSPADTLTNLSLYLGPKTPLSISLTTVDINSITQLSLCPGHRLYLPSVRFKARL